MKLNEVRNIPPTGCDVKKIMREVKSKAQAKAGEYKEYLEKLSKNKIDPVLDVEFLGDGWGEIRHIGNRAGRKAGKTFSFWADASDSCGLLFDLFCKKKTKIRIKTESGKSLGQIVAQGDRRVKILWPKNYSGRKGEEIVVEIDDSEGLVVYGIWLFSDQVLGGEELNQMQGALDFIRQEIKVLEWHQDPRCLLPKDTRLFFVKNSIFKMINSFVAPQVAFNGYCVKLLREQSKINEKLLEYIELATILSGDKD